MCDTTRIKMPSSIATRVKKTKSVATIEMTTIPSTNNIKEKRRLCPHTQRRDRCGICEQKCRHKKRPGRCARCKLECSHGVLLTLASTACEPCRIGQQLMEEDPREEFLHLGFVRDKSRDAAPSQNALSPFRPPPHKHVWRQTCGICASVICEHGAVFAWCPETRAHRYTPKRPQPPSTLWLKRRLRASQEI